MIKIMCYPFLLLTKQYSFNNIVFIPTKFIRWYDLLIIDFINYECQFKVFFQNVIYLLKKYVYSFIL